MRIAGTIDEIGEGPVVLAAGFFDGVHLGHRRVFEETVRRARELGGHPWALTFDRHPRAVLDPPHAPPLITPLPVRLELIGKSGLEGTCLRKFTPDFAAVPAETFALSLCSSGNVVEIHCGANWRFGAGARGTPELLAAIGREHGARVVVAPAVDYGGDPISSTRIRAAVRDGRLADAEAMLGRPHFVRESVVHGRELALAHGFPTANFAPVSDLLPPVGVYAVETFVDGHRFGGVGSIGFRPTFPGARPDKPVLEVHLLDFSGDLYGRTLDIAFLERLRDERAFPDADALFTQIARDAAEAKSVFEGRQHDGR
jgi:riboflavin kinase/FMN adenylyltransferase